MNRSEAEEQTRATKILMNLSNKMKVKKDKKPEKRTKDDGEVEEETAPSKKSQKKTKINRETPEDDCEPVATKNAEDTQSKTRVGIKMMDTNIFKYFKDLTNEEEKSRLDAAALLLQQLSRSKEEDKVCANRNPYETLSSCLLLLILIYRAKRNCNTV